MADDPGIAGVFERSGFDHQHRSTLRQRLVGMAGIHQQHCHAGFPQDEFHAGQRIALIQRHIHAAGLDHRQQGDGQFRRAFQQQRDAAFRADTRYQQAPGQVVGAGVQLRIAQHLATGPQGRGLGRGLDLRLEPGGGALGAQSLLSIARQALHSSALHFRVVLDQHPSALGRRQQIDPAQGYIRVGGGGLQQPTPTRHQPLDRGRVEQIAAVFDTATDAERRAVRAAPLTEADRQVETGGGSVAGLHTLDRQAGQFEGTFQATI